MFCLQCGAEMAIRAQVCPVCGHVYGERERSLVESKLARAVQSSSAPGTSVAPAAPLSPPSSARPASTVKYVGDLASPGLPRDLPGRFVLGVSLGMAADLLLPWVSVNGENVTPASIGAPVIVVVALLAAATLPVYTASLRQHPVWSALPLIVGAFCAGIGGSVWLLLAPVAQIFAISFSSDPSNLALSPQGGLYLFLLGAGTLLVSGQRMLAALHASELAEARHDALRSLQTKPAVAARPAYMAPQTPPAPTSLAAADAARPPAVWQPKPPTPAAPTAAPPAVPASPTTPDAPVMPVVPGSVEWNKPAVAPAPLRPAPGGGWGKPRGPQRLR